MIRVPTLDIAEVGAGGGSIAWVDTAGGLHVGPHSAGADPGPACYGRGGEQATVTDANVVLGYIPPGQLADGSLSVSVEGAGQAVDAIAEAVGLSRSEAARGIHELANATMMRALRAVSSEKGRDPSEFALIAYGGSGPVHATGLAAELGIDRVLVPPVAGGFSATGLLFARAEFHDVRFCRVDARSGGVAELTALEDEMRGVLLGRVRPGRSDMAQVGRRALPRPELGHRDRPAGRRDRPRRAGRARHPLRGGARADLWRARGRGCAGGDQGSAPGIDRAGAYRSRDGGRRARVAERPCVPHA